MFLSTGNKKQIEIVIVAWQRDKESVIHWNFICIKPFKKNFKKNRQLTKAASHVEFHTAQFLTGNKPLHYAQIWVEILISSGTRECVSGRKVKKKKKTQQNEKENKAKKNKQNVNKDGTPVHHRLNKTV